PAGSARGHCQDAPVPNLRAQLESSIEKAVSLSPLMVPTVETFISDRSRADGDGEDVFPVDVFHGVGNLPDGIVAGFELLRLLVAFGRPGGFDFRTQPLLTTEPLLRRQYPGQRIWELGSKERFCRDSA